MPRYHLLLLAMGSWLLQAQEPQQPEQTPQDTMIQMDIETQVPEAPPSEPRKGLRRGSQLYLETAYNQFLGMPDTLQGSVEGLGSIKLNLSSLTTWHIGAFYFGAGLGVAIRETRFAEPIVLFRRQEALGYHIDSLPSTVQAKSKLQLGYVRLPLEIGFLYKKFQAAFFGYGEFLLWSKHKRKYAEGSELSRFVVHGNRTFQTNPLQYGIGARIGYRGVGLFAAYSLSFLWGKGKGPAEVRPFQVGIYFFDPTPGTLKKKRRKSGFTATAF